MSIIEKFYSEAFQDGFDYASERLYAEKEEEKKRGKGAYVAAGLGGGALGTYVGARVGANNAGKDVFESMYGKNWVKDIEKQARKGTSAKEIEKSINDKAEAFMKDKKKAEELGVRAIKKIGKGALIGGGIGTGLGVGSVALYRHLKDRNKD